MNNCFTVRTLQGFHQNLNNLHGKMFAELSKKNAALYTLAVSMSSGSMLLYTLADVGQPICINFSFET